MNKLLLLPLLFYPVIVAFLFEYNFCNFDISRYQNFAEGILFGCLLFGSISLMKVGKIRTILFIVLYLVYAASTWIESSFYYLYQANFNTSTVFILLESNLRETKDFFASTIETSLILFFILTFLPLFIIIPFFTRQIRFFSWFLNPPSLKNRLIIGLIGALGFFSIMKLTGIIEQNLPYLLVKTSTQYKKESNNVKLYDLTTKVGSFKNSIRKRNDNEETFVIVIGNSHTKNKMSIYGYDRPTNPKLEAIKDELVIFDKVISPSTNNKKALERVLTLSNYEDSTATVKGSVVQLFNSVGFKSYWISNQRPLGEEDNLLTKIASAADESVFINMTSSKMATPYDEALLEPFDKALNSDYPKKVIFLHLQGNHLNYNKRYPEQFQVFKTLDDKHPEIENIIDAYDNATIYNDYILNEIIEKLKTKNNASFMLYFSNHGEEVYETQDHYGHSEEDASKPMYDIPFILWQSEAFKKNRPIRFRTYRKYMTDDLIHSIGHLANIKFDTYEAKRSVFSIYYKNRIRYIQGDVDYDKLFE